MNDNWKRFMKVFFQNVGIVSSKMVANNELRLLPQKGYVQSTLTSLNICVAALLSFMSPLVIRWKGFLRGWKGMLETKIWWIKNELVVLEGAIKCLIHYAINIDTAYVQVAKRREDTKPWSNVMQPNGPISYGHVLGKETCRSHSCCSNFYNEVIPKEPSTKNTNKKDECYFRSVVFPVIVLSMRTWHPRL